MSKIARFVILKLESTDGWRRVTNVDDRVDREGYTVMRSRSVEKKTGRAYTNLLFTMKW